MYTIPPTGGIVGGGALALTGGTLLTSVFGFTILVLGLGLGILLFARERRRRKHVAEQDALPRYRRRSALS
jgi:hypothetical protein